MNLYDQWKTASPYDDDRDVIEEVDKFLKERADPNDAEEEYLVELLIGLREVLKEETGL